MLRAASRGRSECLLFAAVLLLVHTNVLGEFQENSLWGKEETRRCGQAVAEGYQRLCQPYTPRHICPTFPAGDELQLVSGTGRSLLWQAASEYTAIGQAQGLSSSITGTTLNLTCPCAPFSAKHPLLLECRLCLQHSVFRPIFPAPIPDAASRRLRQGPANRAASIKPERGIGGRCAAHLHQCQRRRRRHHRPGQRRHSGTGLCRCDAERQQRQQSGCGMGGTLPHPSLPLPLQPWLSMREPAGAGCCWMPKANCSQPPQSTSRRAQTSCWETT